MSGYKIDPGCAVEYEHAENCTRVWQVNETTGEKKLIAVIAMGC